jgi:DNA-binding SARP family transcriptional activator/predicted ATPase
MCSTIGLLQGVGMSTLKLLLLGSPRLERDNVPVKLERRKALTLLAYLAVTGEPQSREALATLLWPDKDESQAHAYLRVVLFTLKQALGTGQIAISRERIALASNSDRLSDFWLDVADFRRLLANWATHGHAPNDVCPICLAPLTEAVALYRADFMAGFTLPDSPEFDEWQFFQAESLRRDLAAALERLIHGHSAQGELEQAILFARRWVALDPLHEPAQRCLMQLYAQSGQRAAALRQYEESHRLLATQVGGSPEEATTALYEAIKAGKFAERGVRLEDRFSNLLQHPPATRPLPSFMSAALQQPDPPALFVAREQELAELAAALTTARSGAGQILFVIGGAGRGKTMLVQEFARQAQAADAELLVISGYGNAHIGIGDPYLPFREALTMLTGEVEAKWAGGLISAEHARSLWQALPLTIPALVEHAPDLVGSFVSDKGLHERAAAFAAPDVPWFNRLVALTSADAGAKLEQQRIFAQYSAVLSAIAREQPLLLILEDLHWVDSASSGLLFHLSREAARSRILIVGTYRPDEVALSRGEIPHPLAGILSELKRWHGDIWLDLGELAEAEGRRFVEAYLDMQPNRLDPAFREALFGRTGGHALFTVELLREMQARGDVRPDAEGQWIEGPAIDWNTLPARVEGVIEKRIQRLAKELQAILTVASVEGETFTAEVVARIQQVNERGLVQQLSRELDKRHRLVTAHILAWLGPQRLSLYRFRHQLFQQYVYHNLAEMERAYLHEAVGSVLEAIYGEQTEQVAVQLARHFEQAGLTEKAVTYLLQAGKRAARLSAYQEAIAHLTKGLALLESLPETAERAQKELELQIALGNVLMAIKGYAAAEVEQTYNRAWQLCQQVYAGKTSQIFPILYGRWIFYLTRGEHQTAYQLAQEFLDLAQRQQDPAIVVAHQCMGWCFCMGELVSARAHFEQIAALYNVEQHRPLTFQYGQDPGMAGLSGRALVLWLLGYPEQARRSSDQAIILGREATHAHSLAGCLHFSSVFHAFCQETVVAQELTEEAIAICSKLGLAGWLAWAIVIRGWALSKQGQGEAGIAQIRQGLAVVQAAGAEVAQTYQLTLLVEAYQSVGQPEAGLRVLTEAMAQVEKTEERFWEAEIYRLRGELLLKAEGGGMKDKESPEECFLKAIEVARRQAGKSLELRATVSLGRLWQQQGKKDEARHLLAKIYCWFSEGFDTIDLQQAKALIEELSA